jgi:hypothetical protein
VQMPPKDERLVCKVWLTHSMNRNRFYRRIFFRLIESI